MSRRKYSRAISAFEWKCSLKTGIFLLRDIKHKKMFYQQVFRFMQYLTIAVSIQWTGIMQLSNTSRNVVYSLSGTLSLDFWIITEYSYHILPLNNVWIYRTFFSRRAQALTISTLMLTCVAYTYGTQGDPGNMDNL